MPAQPASPQSASAADSVTVEGTLDQVVFANEESAWSVVRVELDGRAPAVTAVGNLVGVQPGERVRLTGHWEQSPKYGRQLKIDSYTTVVPRTAAAVERYLSSGLIRGIGKAMAQRLVQRFGEGTLDVIDHHPERLSEVAGIGPKRSKAIREAWVEQRDVKELMLFLHQHEVSTTHALRAYKTYGQDALRVVREEPYRLATDIWGIGFRTADQIAAQLGISPQAPQRAQAAVVHLLREASGQGHVYLPRGRLVRAAAELLALDEALAAAAVEALGADGTLVIEAPNADGEPAVYLAALAASEIGLAERLTRLLRAPLARSLDLEPGAVGRELARFESAERLQLAPQQRRAVESAVGTRVLVITGGPGTGKTTLVRAIVRVLTNAASGERLRIQLAAPTGRAAKRLAEATGQEARTVHRLLEFEPRSRSFQRGEERPLGADVLIVDEASMLDTSLAYHVVKALPEGCRLILVGDVDQLPSVGPGNVLSDLIASGAVAVVRLSEIFRQAQRSAIVRNAHRVLHGELPEADSGDSSSGSDAGSDYFFIERNEPEELLSTLAYLVHQRIPQSFGFDPVRDIQVLSPMNRGSLGVIHLNETLRELLNPGGTEVRRGGRSLRVGDKVMQVRNNYDLDVFNGDLGRIVAIDRQEQAVTVETDGRRVVYDFGDLDELVLAYACSIHKSQGSEYPCVVLPVHTQHYVMLERNLLYTALTRARKLAVLVGQRRALGIAVRNQRTRTRFTRLDERLKELAAG